LGLSVGLSIYAAFLGISDIPVSDGLGAAWLIGFALLVAFWAREDAAVKKVHRTLDFSFYFLLVWPLALPYYLIKTRGVEGVVYFLGFAVLYFAPFVVGMLAYAYLVAE
jgi:hypothetical protein